MSRKKNKKPKTRSAFELNKSTSSAVALSALQQTGAGKHGGNARQQNRRSRQSTRKSLKNGDW